MLVSVALGALRQPWLDRVEPPKHDTGKGQESERACADMKRRLRDWTSSHGAAPARLECEVPKASLAACPETSASGCCVTSSPRALHPEALRWWNSTPSLIAVSLATSDRACRVERSARNALEFTAEAVVVLHVGCGSPASDATRAALWAESARLVLNPDCVPTFRAFGSILHAHVRNFLYARRLARAHALPTPSHFLFESADMTWLRRGVEQHVRATGASAFHASSQQLPLPALTSGALADDDWAAIVDGSALPLHQRGLRALMQKHEGSFLPWGLMANFTDLLASRGSLGRLNLRSCMCKLAAGGPIDVSHPNRDDGSLPFCIEEMYVANFVAARSAAGTVKLGDLEINEHSYTGTVTMKLYASHSGRTDREGKFAVKAAREHGGNMVCPP